jgi:hypothetical protein
MVVSFISKGIISKRNIRFFENLKSQIESWYIEKYNDGLQYKKRHKFNSIQLKDRLLKLTAEDKTTQDKVEQVFDFTTKEFMLSDNNINTLEKLQAEDIIGVTKTESIEQIRARIFQFIEIGKFGK